MTGVDSTSSIVLMIQQQQELLHTIVEIQKLMQPKQDEFDSKLQELMKHSESSATSSSPDTVKKKCRISRMLTVSVHSYVTVAEYIYRIDDSFIRCPFISISFTSVLIRLDVQ